MTKKGKEICTFALDRIQNIISLPHELFREHKTFDPHTYFNDIVGVTRNAADTPTHIEFFADNIQAPYIKTKPIHASQNIVEERKDGIIFSLDIVPNFELERELIGFGEGLKILSPNSFMRRIRRKVRLMHEIYFDTQSPEIS